MQVPVQPVAPIEPVQAKEIKPVPVLQNAVPVQVQAPVPSPVVKQEEKIEEKKLSFIPRVAPSQIDTAHNEIVAKSTVAPSSAGSKFCNIK